MIPAALVKAADENGWGVGTVQQKKRLLWISLGRDDISIYIWRDRWRHTTARAYRGNALAGVMRTQAEVVAFLTT